MLWHVRGTQLYMLGTVHLMDAEPVLASKRRRAYQRAARVAFEYEFDMPGGPLRLLPEGQYLSEHLPEKLFRRLATKWRDLGFDQDELDDLKPWVAGMSVAFELRRRPEILFAHSIDHWLLRRSRADGKEVKGLESYHAATDALDAGLPSEQATWVEYCLDERRPFSDDLEAMVEAWHTGAVAPIQRIYQHRMKTAPRMFGGLVGARNRAWLPEVLAMLDDGIPTLVAAGALHFVGGDGLPALLEDNGYSVSAIDA